MKNLKFLHFPCLFLSLIIFVQCTTDPIPGPDGEDGIDGVDGVDGASGTTECAACHNVSTNEGVHASYLYSGHATGSTASRGSSASCAACHSNEGFIDYTTLGAVNENGYENPTKINCSTCHDTHTTFDFENDGFDYALRTLRGVDLITDSGYTINYEGTSNLCANCHQPRSGPPVDDGQGMYEITSTRFGPHHGPQSTFLEGIQGGEVAGTTEYPAVGSATHRTGSSCTQCHMGETTGEIDGNHTWIPTENACLQCHTNGSPDGVAGLEDDMATLLTLLKDVGILEEDEDGDVSPVRGIYSISEAEAAWNYILLLEDSSKGVHNPRYARALVANSIEAVDAE